MVEFSQDFVEEWLADFGNRYDCLDFTGNGNCHREGLAVS